MNGDKLFFTVIETSLIEQKYKFKVLTYDFKTLKHSILVERENSLPLIESPCKEMADGSDHPNMLVMKPYMGMISVFTPIDQDGHVEKEFEVLSDQQFMEKTLVRLYFKSIMPNTTNEPLVFSGMY